MKAEHLDEQPSITNTDDKVLSKLSQHWLKIIEGIADTKGGQEALDNYTANKIKEAELRGRKCNGCGETQFYCETCERLLQS